MIDLHTHTLFSDGELLPSELVRRAEVKGYKAIALTDHVDSSNIDFVIPRIVNICKTLNRNWKIRSIPGVEITHAPLQEIKPLVKFARKAGAKIVIVHGETVSEPVIPGTNRVAIAAGCDILAHPGNITKNEVALAKASGVCLELTARKSHSLPNKRLFGLARSIGAKLVLNTDAHSGKDLISDAQARKILKSIGLKEAEIRQVFKNSEILAKR
jgi:histidinol phosphatase-like PHP family hydrolase